MYLDFKIAIWFSKRVFSRITYRYRYRSKCQSIIMSFDSVEVVRIQIKIIINFKCKFLKWKHTSTFIYSLLRIIPGRRLVKSISRNPRASQKYWAWNLQPHNHICPGASAVFRVKISCYIIMSASDSVDSRFTFNILCSDYK